MADNSSFITGSGTRSPQGAVDRPRPIADRPHRDDIPSPGRTPSKAKDQGVLQKAFDRLDRLLSKDAGEPRSDVHQRGYYINILV